MTTLLMSPPPISFSHRLIRCRYSNSRDVVASSPSFCQSAQESLLAGYFLRTLSAPITNGIVSVTVSIFHILALSVHIIRPPSLFLDRTDHEGASVLDSIFRWCQHPFLPAASETEHAFSFLSMIWLLLLPLPIFTGASKSTIIMVCSSPVLFLEILSHVSAGIPQLRDITRYGKYQGWLTTVRFQKYLVDLTSPTRRPMHSPRQLQVHQSWWVLLSLYFWPVDSFNFES